MLYTVLINKENKMKEKILDKINLVNDKDIDNLEIKVEENTLKEYQRLKEDLLEKNIEIGIESAFHTISYQEELRNRLLKERGEDYVKKYVAEKDESEHLTGMALDIAIKIKGKFSNELEDSKYFEKIHPILHKYGFILRYPKGKEKITGYDYEPWHIRYVGQIPAKIMYEENLTLEEYHKYFGCVLYVNKPKDITSFDVVHKISKLFGIKKVGHTGTLDPLATGVMLVAVGKATKIVELLTAKDKEYIAGAELGIKTDTYDITGEILDRKEVPNNINLKEIISSFQKTYLQEVPIYSAIKVGGKKLYNYARENKKVELPKKEVTIKKIELLEENKNTFSFKALVTKGCYIRSLIMDIGESMNTYATMTSLIRTKQGNISIEQTNTLEEITNNQFQIHKIEEVLDYPIIKVSKEEEFLISNGVIINDKWKIEDKVIFHSQEGKLLGIYEVDNNILKAWKNFV